MKTLKTNLGVDILCDEEDFVFLSKYNWYLARGYAYSKTLKKNGHDPKKPVVMHRLLTGAKAGEDVDHLNGNPLDNRKQNLRICNRVQNCRNRKSRKNSRSIYKGVQFLGKSWRVRIQTPKGRICLGLFPTERAAAIVYDIAAKSFFGKFARCNILPNGEFRGS